MGYDVMLKEPSGKTCQVSAHRAGSTYDAGGETRADVSITFNYAKHFYQSLDRELGLRWLHGKTGAETTQRLQNGIEKLSDDGQDLHDYWASTPFNAKVMLRLLASWANQHLDGRWDIL